MDIRKGVDIGDDRLTASIEQPVLITRCVFHTLLQSQPQDPSIVGSRTRSALSIHVPTHEAAQALSSD